MSLTKLQNTFNTNLFLLDCQRKGQNEVLEESLRPNVQIVCEDGELFAHHSVLISSSKVFYDHFVQLPSCAYKEIIVIHLLCLDYELDVVEPIIYSLYTGNCLVPKNKLNIVLDILSTLKIDETELQWSTASRKDITTTNDTNCSSMRIRRFAETVQFPSDRGSSSSTQARNVAQEVASTSSSNNSSSEANGVPRKGQRSNMPHSILKVLKREKGGIKIVDQDKFEVDESNNCNNNTESETFQNVASTTTTNNHSERKRSAPTDNFQVSEKTSKSKKNTPTASPKLNLTVDEVCKTYKLVDVEIETNDDINGYHKYRKHVFPLLNQKNPKTHASTMAKLVSAKWRDYKTKLNSRRNDEDIFNATILNEEAENESSTLEQQESDYVDSEATVLVNMTTNNH